VLNSFIQAALRVAILWEVILQTIWFAATILKGVPLNIQTKTVLSIYDPVKGYCLKLLLVIYEIICLDNVGVLPEYIFGYCISHIGSN
jgi:hypothetical protein